MKTQKIKTEYLGQGGFATVYKEGQVAQKLIRLDDFYYASGFYFCDLEYCNLSEFPEANQEEILALSERDDDFRRKYSLALWEATILEKMSNAGFDFVPEFKSLQYKKREVSVGRERFMMYAALLNMDFLKGNKFFEYIDMLEKVQTLYSYTCPGLYERLLKDGVISLRQTVSNLEQMHNKGIIFGDLTPNNIIVHPDEKAKFIDFGTSYLDGKREDDSGAFRYFTQSHASPEFMYGEEVSPSLDIYSFGCCFYELIRNSTICNEENIYAQKSTYNKSDMRRISRRMASKLTDEELFHFGKCIDPDPSERSLQHAKKLTDLVIQRMNEEIEMKSQPKKSFFGFFNK